MDYDSMLDEINSNRPVDFVPDMKMYKALWGGDNEFINLLHADTIDSSGLSIDTLKETTVHEGFYWGAVDDYFLTEDDLKEFLKSKVETDPDFLVSVAMGQFESPEKIAVLEIDDEYHTTRETVDSVQAKLDGFISDSTELQEQFQKWVDGPDSQYINRTQFTNYITASSKSIDKVISTECNNRICAELDRQGEKPTLDKMLHLRHSDPKYTEDGIKTELIDHARYKEKVIAETEKLSLKIPEVTNEKKRPVMKM